MVRGGSFRLTPSLPGFFWLKGHILGASADSPASYDQAVRSQRVSPFLVGQKRGTDHGYPPRKMVELAGFEPACSATLTSITTGLFLYFYKSREVEDVPLPDILYS
jgi:hypothetical protein